MPVGLRSLPRLLVLASVVAAIPGCAAPGIGGPSEPQAVISQASGDLVIENSLDGQAIFQAQGLAPGKSVTGTVQLSNSGGLAGDLGLQQLEVQDLPGSNGGRLSDAVQLDVQDVTGGNAIPVFAGQLGALQTKDLGSIAPGEARTYRFTASLPDGGLPPTPTGGDNAYVGSALTVRYAWNATAPDPGTGGGGGGGGGGGNATPPNPTIKVVTKKLLKKGWLDLMVACDRPCRLSAWAMLPTTKRVRKSVKTRQKAATLTTPGKASRIRLKVSAKRKRQLGAALRKKRRVMLRVTLNVASADGGPARTYTRKATVRRPKPKRPRRS